MFLRHNEHVASVDGLNIHEDDASLVLKDNTCGRASFGDVAEYAVVHREILGQPDEEVHFSLWSIRFCLLLAELSG